MSREGDPALSLVRGRGAGVRAGEVEDEGGHFESLTLLGDLLEHRT